ncbi:MAG: hypothetical protein ACKPFF_21650, partial [Planktothrix sp.]
FINPDDKLIDFIHQECKKPKARRLGFPSSGNDKVKTINKLLKAIGLSWERKQLRDKGDVLTRYQVLPLSDLEQALTDAIARRIDERIAEATKQTNSENEYPDFASERVDTEETIEPIESVTDVPDHFYKKETKTSVTATLPAGSKIELSLPIDFYLKDSLVFELVNGKNWQIVEYVQIHGKDYVDLKGESGDKVKIPLDWILYCCNCVQ